MSSVVATAHPYRPVGDYVLDLLPLVGVLYALVLARFVVGLRLTAPRLGILFVVGTLGAYVADGWGLVPTFGGAFLLASLWGLLARRAESR